MIGQSDAHTFLLDTETGAVLATWVDDPAQTPLPVASSFSEFYRGLASVYLAGLGSPDAVAAAAEVAAGVGASEQEAFWHRFAVRAG